MAALRPIADEDTLFLLVLYGTLCLSLALSVNPLSVI